MNKYLVGGACRDMLMGLEPKDRDYVIVGSTPEQMLSAGFSQVGADFPVFLHPETGDEYALARREKKTGVGYLGFTSEFGTDVTLEEDLSRRDLTINSIAFQTERDMYLNTTGEDFDCFDENEYVVYDPFGGKQDIHDKILRHTSSAFEEDPVRVLRIARFKARFGKEWDVAPETKELIEKMGNAGVLAELTPERVWKELSRALTEPYPALFFDTLNECNVLEHLFPIIHKMKTVEEPIKWHPEGNTYEHTMLVLTAARELSDDLTVLYAALTHDFGKTATNPADYPKHYGHEVTGVPLVEKFSDELKVPSSLKKYAKMVCRYHMHMHKLNDMKPLTFVRMFDRMRAYHDPVALDILHTVGCADARGRLGSHNIDISNLSMIKEYFEASKISFGDAVKKYSKGIEPKDGEKIKLLIEKARQLELAEYKNSLRESANIKM